MRHHSGLQQWKEAVQIAKDHGLKIVQKGERYLLYRQSTPRNVYLGFRTSVQGLRQFVARCATAH